MILFLLSYFWCNMFLYKKEEKKRKKKERKEEKALPHSPPISLPSPPHPKSPPLCCQN